MYAVDVLSDPVGVVRVDGRLLNLGQVPPQEEVLGCNRHFQDRRRDLCQPMIL